MGWRREGRGGGRTSAGLSWGGQGWLQVVLLDLSILETLTRTNGETVTLFTDVGGNSKDLKDWFVASETTVR